MRINISLTCFIALTSSTIAKALPQAPLLDPSGLNKSRFISFIPGNPGLQTAIRVTPIYLHHVNPPYTGGAITSFAAMEGATLYAGPPQAYTESYANQTYFVASFLTCSPHYRDWTALGMVCSGVPQLCAVDEDCKRCSSGNSLRPCTTDADCPGGASQPPCAHNPVDTCSEPLSDNVLHVTGAALVPGSLYKVELLDASCAGNEAGCTAVTAPIQIETTRWADVESPFNPPSFTTQPDASDISAMINTFRDAIGAPQKVRAVLAAINSQDTSGVVDPSSVGFRDISACVDAYKGRPYPYKPSSHCTGGEKTCGSDADCTGATCVGGSDAGDACIVEKPDCRNGGVCTPNMPPCATCP